MRAFLKTKTIPRKCLGYGIDSPPPIKIPSQYCPIIDLSNGCSYIDYFGQPICKRAYRFQIGEFVIVGNLIFKITD